jgi:hypothetical protein
MKKNKCKILSTENLSPSNPNTSIDKYKENKSLRTRIIQKNLVYLIGLPQKYANENVLVNL